MSLLVATKKDRKVLYYFLKMRIEQSLIFRLTPVLLPKLT